MLKSCKYCGRIHDSKIDCGKKPKPKPRFIKDTEQIRYTSAMKKKSESIKRNANYLCEVCLDNNILVHASLETHHIIKLQHRPDMALEDLNLICLCPKCHKKAEKGLINAQYLRKLAQKREKKHPPTL